MITFTALGHTAIRAEYSDGVLIALPGEVKPENDAIVLKSTPDDMPEAKVISWPGEYDVQSLAIRGIGHDDGEIVSYSVEVDGVRCAFVCSPMRPWTDHEIELLGDIDVLFIPTDDPKALQKLVDEVDPRVLIPLDTGGAEKHAESLKICGAANVAPVAEYKVKGALPAEGRETVVLQIKK